MKVPPYYYHLKCNTSTVDVTSVCFHLVKSPSPLFGSEKSSPFYLNAVPYSGELKGVLVKC